MDGVHPVPYRTDGQPRLFCRLTSSRGGSPCTLAVNTYKDYTTFLVFFNIQFLKNRAFSPICQKDHKKGKCFLTLRGQ